MTANENRSASPAGDDLSGPQAVLLVEDDRRLSDTLCRGLEEHEFRVTPVYTAAAVGEGLRDGAYALVVLDLGLPDRDGIEVLLDIRTAHERLPILVLTARDGIDDRVLGLNAGADDYLTKPFAFQELLARMRALTRRGVRRSTPSVLQVGDLSIDLLQRRVRRGRTHLDLTPREFDVLAFLAHKAGATVSRDALMREVWNITSRASPMNNVIDVLMTRLRDKIDKPFDQALLLTVRGVGYQLRGQP